MMNPTKVEIPADEDIANPLSEASSATPEVTAMREYVRQRMARTHFPANLQRRLVADIEVPGHYTRMTDLASLELQQPNSSYWGISCMCCCCAGQLVEDGDVGLLRTDDEFQFMAPGYHKFSVFGTELRGTVPLNTTDKAVANGPVGFVTITEGRIGLLQIFGEYKLLAPGTYQWSSSAVTFLGSVNVTKNITKLGPYKLVTVPIGDVAVTHHNGSLRVLGLDQDDNSSRTFFLDDPKWVMEGMLSTQDQTDRLEGNNLMSKDNVELLMVAMSQWKIVDPIRALRQCGSSMDEIRENVNSLVRAVIARIVAGTNIGSGPVGGVTANPVVMGQPTGAQAPEKPAEEAVLAQLMLSEQAVAHMAELTANMTRMGIEVLGVYVPEKRMKNSDIRHEVAKQSVIGIKAEAQRAAADASAYATIREAEAMAQSRITKANATAKATVTEALAEAEAIEAVAQAHTKAGQMLGVPEGTAARLALTEKTASTLEGANVTLFSGAPNNMPFMLSTAPKTMK